MASEVTVHSNLSVKGGITVGDFSNGFPSNPSPGMLIVKNEALWGYVKLGDILSWYPLLKLPKSYIHVQGLAALTWTVSHGLNSPYVFYQIQDDTGNYIMAPVTVIDDNTIQINLTEAMTGKCLVFAADDIEVPTISASLLNIANGVVVIDSSGVKINGVSVLTSASITISDVAGLTSALSNKANTSAIPTTVSALANDSNFQTASQVTSAIQAVVGAAPAALDTLVEIANQLATDESAVAALVSELSTKANVSDINYATIGPSRGLVDALSSISSASGTQTINCSDVTYWKGTLVGNITGFNLNSIPAGGPYTLTMKLIQGGSGGYTVTWPSNVKWPDGTPPTLTTAVGKYDMVGLVTDDGGSSWTGCIGGFNY